jgi:hypothetical protein
MADVVSYWVVGGRLLQVVEGGGRLLQVVVMV